MSIITSHHNIPLVILSILIAVISAYTSLNLVGRLIHSKGMSRILWLLGGAFSLGFGIWSMHFIAMLSHDLHINVTYNIILVILSIIFAILACGVAFFIVSREYKRNQTNIFGAFFIGTGIISMHYVGMAAMEMDAIIEYNHYLLILSFIIAYVTSYIALKLFHYFRINTNETGFPLMKVGSAVLMGIGISGMHFVGMAAADFIVIQNHAHIMDGPSIDSHLIAISIGLGMLLILGFIIASIYYDKRMEQKETQLEFIDNIYRALIMTANDAIILSNSKGIIISWNKSAENIFGYTEKEAIGRRLELIIPERYRKAHQNGMNRFLKTNEPQVIGSTVELSGLRKDGEEFPIELSLSTLKKGEQIYFSGIIRDVSERKKSENRINELVYRDPLTNYPNRRFLNEHLARSLQQATYNNQTLAVMFIDLDRFKYINDTLGHGIGDKLLIEVAKRMDSCIEEKDMLARQGGDEYILVIPHTSSQKVANIAKDILDVLNVPFMIEENELFISASIGISMYPTDGKSAEVLIKNADTAMYRAKELGKNNYQFYTFDMNEIMARKMKLEIGLRKALENEEFELYYQPQVSLDTGEIKGVEALIRWRHPELGLVSPFDFIPLAEENGLIIPIGEWVLNSACEQAKIWANKGLPMIRISVNISARQFQHSNFIDSVKEILDKTKLDANYLELELTETVVQDPEYAIPVMQQLNIMGVKLSLDDFGTGYSSLSYLKSFPLDTLKIDKSFIQTVNAGVKDAAIVNTIINMANSLDLTVIAEGVETNDQLEFLKDESCDEYQGYLFSKPVSSIEMEEKLKKLI